MTRKAIIVDPNTNPWDRALVRMSEHGFTADVIVRETGLSLSQVQYRRFKLNCGPMNYRRGKSTAAKILLASIRRDNRAIESLEKFIQTGQR